MKKFSTSSKKNKPLFVDDRSGEETVTPRVKKSYSVTNANYLQLQLDTSSKKRQSMQKSLQIKDKRIHQLQKQVRQQQDYINDHLLKHKEVRYRYQHEKDKNQRIQKELQDAVDLCKAMKDKCKELIERNQYLEKSGALAKQKFEFQEKKAKEWKQARRKEKAELRQLIIPLLQAYASRSNVSSEEIAKVSKVI